MENLPKNLVYYANDRPGYLRKRRGRGFTFFDPKGNKVSAKELPNHLQSLYIPPAWTNVWLSPKPNAHLQATGYDEQNRKQYVYHADWNVYRQSEKFSQLVSFAKALPRIRKRMNEDLKLDGWPRNKVIALVIALLDACYMRIGNEQYRKNHQTFGLTTLRRKHLHTDEALAIFSYRGKSGVNRQVTLEDPELVNLVKECSELPGYELFRYADEAGKARLVDSEDVNDYLREVSGTAFSSKTFRTWGGTVTAVEMLDEALQRVAENPKKELLPTVVQLTAAALGNTASVCREYYIHPAVLHAIEQHDLPQLISRSRVKQSDECDLDKFEKICLKIIKAWQPDQTSVRRQAS